VKVSYFPRWHAVDGSTLLPVSPGFMLVYPSSRSVDLVYRRNAIDWIGLALTIVGLTALAAFSLKRSWSEQFVATIRKALSPVLLIWSRWRIAIGVLLVLIGLAAAVGTRFTLRSPDREYDDAQTAYKARDFPTAIKLYTDWTKQDRDTFKQATALYQLGVSHSELEHHAAAVMVLERLRFQFPNVDYTAGTLFHLARNYAAIGSTADAESRAAELLDAYPDSSWVRRLRTETPQLLNEPATKQK